MRLIKYMSFWIFFALILFSGCATSIKKIKKDPARLHGKKIHIRGQVVSSLELSELNCFTIRNKTGNILVVTDNMLPLKNDKIRVNGVLDQQFTYKNQNLLVIKEKKMKLRKSPAFKKIKEKL